VRAVLPPFIFRPLVETAFRMRTPFRRRSHAIRRMLARYQPDIGRHPLERGYPALPFRWNTAHLFWPVVPYFGGYYAERLWDRALAKLRVPRRLRPESWRRRLGLWSEPRVRAVLDPRRMRLAALMDERALSDYLAASRQPRFAYDAHWHRLLALEMTLDR
jgi:hypothetical protein